jgi:sterol 3beta-glucosyltransferase
VETALHPILILATYCSIEIQSYNTDVERWDPFTGGASSVLGTLTDMTVSLGRTFVDPFTEYKRQRRELKEGGTGGSVNSPAGSAALAAGKGLGRVYGSMTKGTLVDLPLALAEGLRNVPRLYGADADDYGKVTDWKSGTVVGGKVSSRFSCAMRSTELCLLT